MHTRQDIVDIVSGLTEQRAKKLDLTRLLDLEIQKICNRKRYWWRRKALSFQSAVGTATYDLSGGVSPIAVDFLEMIFLVRGDSATSTPEVVYEPDPFKQTQAIASTAQDDPSRWFLEPGSAQTIRLTPVPNDIKPYSGLYWASPNPGVPDPSSPIPLIPDQYHYVVLAALERRVFRYLFGQNDSRYVTAEAEYRSGLEDLDAYTGPATREAQEFRSSSPVGVVRATR